MNLKIKKVKSDLRRANVALIVTFTFLSLLNLCVLLEAYISKQSSINIPGRCSENVKMEFGLYLDFVGYTNRL